MDDLAVTRSVMMSSNQAHVRPSFVSCLAFKLTFIYISVKRPHVIYYGNRCGKPIVVPVAVFVTLASRNLADGCSVYDVNVEDLIPNFGNSLDMTSNCFIQSRCLYDADENPVEYLYYFMHERQVRNLQLWYADLIVLLVRHFIQRTMNAVSMITIWPLQTFTLTEFSEVLWS
jgi:hypothetical protein